MARSSFTVLYDLIIFLFALQYKLTGARSCKTCGWESRSNSIQSPHWGIAWNSIAPARTQYVAAFSREQMLFIYSERFSTMICSKARHRMPDNDTDAGQRKETSGREESSDGSRSKSTRGYWSPMLWKWRQDWRFSLVKDCFAQMN